MESYPARNSQTSKIKLHSITKEKKKKKIGLGVFLQMYSRRFTAG